MKRHALATDFDGTLAEDGRLESAAIAALHVLRDRRVQTILVTGRSVREIQSLGHDLSLFRLIVAEDGAVMFDPSTNENVPLAPPVDEGLADELRMAGVKKLKSGQCVISAGRESEATVEVSVRLRPGAFHVLQDKGSLSILPAGVDKASGLRAAFSRLGLDPVGVIGMGDAENDMALLQECGLRVAPQNAMPLIKAVADHVLGSGPAGALAELTLLLLARRPPFA